MNDLPGRPARTVRHKLPVPCGAHVLARALKRHQVEVMIDPKAYPPLTLYEGKIKFWLGVR